MAIALIGRRVLLWHGRIQESQAMPNAEEGIANFVQRGEIRVGGLRMCLFEIAGGFYSIREELERTIGPATSTIIYHAGVNSGKRFVSSAARIGMIKRGAGGLADCIDIYSQAGFGDFTIVETDHSVPRVLVECTSPIAFEAFAFKENNSTAKVPVCDYSRGVFAGFYQQLVGRHDVMCVESHCRASGSSRCVFEIGRQDRLMAVAMSVRAKV